MGRAASIVPFTRPASGFLANPVNCLIAQVSQIFLGLSLACRGLLAGEPIDFCMGLDVTGKTGRPPRQTADLFFLYKQLSITIPFLEENVMVFSLCLISPQ